MIHELKIYPEFLTCILSGSKKHEIRRDDRVYTVGDLLNLREWDPVTEQFTGLQQGVEITYISRNFVGIVPGYVVLSVKLIQ